MSPCSNKHVCPLDGKPRARSCAQNGDELLGCRNLLHRPLHVCWCVIYVIYVQLREKSSMGNPINSSLHAVPPTLHSILHDSTFSIFLAQVYAMWSVVTPVFPLVSSLQPQFFLFMRVLKMLLTAFKQHTYCGLFHVHQNPLVAAHS